MTLLILILVDGGDEGRSGREKQDFDYCLNLKRWLFNT